MKLVRAFDPVLHLHSSLVAELCVCFSEHLTLPPSNRQALEKAGLLHDIGKLNIPMSILNKPAPLTEKERAIMETHALLGYEMLRAAGETDEMVLAIVRDHHERLDGSGYPRKLKAEQIPQPVRMVTLCDVFAAIIEPRPYADGMMWDKALERMAEKRTRLDMGLLSEFATMLRNVRDAKSHLRVFGERSRRDRS